MPGPRPMRPERRPDLDVSWLVIVAVFILASMLSLFARGGNTLRIDRETTRLLQELDGQPWQTLADVGNALGESVYAVPVALLLLAVNLVRRNVRNTLFLLVLLVLRGAATVLKGLFDSPRPTIDAAEVVGNFDGFGFPSGHALTSTIALGGLAFLAARRTDSTRVRVVLGAVWLAGMAMTGFARIWIGAHWMTDVIGGSLYGLGVVLLAANLSASLVDGFGGRRHPPPVTKTGSPRTRSSPPQ